MKRLIQFNNRNEAGASLAELLASIVIFSLLMGFFLSMFISSSKTNIKSEEQIDATYVAQTELENLYAISKKVEYSARELQIETFGYTLVSSAADKSILKKEITGSKPEYDIELILKNTPVVPGVMETGIITSAEITVTARETAVGSNTTGEMELLLVWKEDPPTP